MRYSFTFIILFFTCTIARAGGISPDAGQILNEIEQTLPEIDMMEFEVEPEAEEEVIDPDEPKVYIQGFRIIGNESLDRFTLDHFLKDYRKKQLPISTIRSLNAELANYYRQKGYVAQVILPDQDITEGIVTMQVVEAELEDIEIALQEKNYINAETLKKFFKTKTKTLSLKEIDDQIFLINELPGISAKATLRPGSLPKKTGVIIQTKYEKRFVSSVSYDNYGSRSTGAHRGLATFVMNNPLSRGDQLSLTALKSEGVNFGMVNYEMPIGFDGLRVGFKFSSLDYEVILDEFDATKPEGRSTSYAINTRYPVFLSQNAKIYLKAEYENKSFFNETTAGTTSDYDTDAIDLAVESNFVDTLLFYGAITELSATYTKGEVNLSGSPNEASDKIGANTQGDFNKIRFNLNRTQYLNSDYALRLKYAYQWADQNLDSSEKLYLGGPNGVRAYPVNEGAGAQGFLANLELTRNFENNLQGRMFYDMGSIKQYIDNSSVNTDPNSLTLKGFGVGIDWTGPKNSVISLNLARRVGKNPNPTVTGKDQDGSNKDNFVWLRGAVLF